VAASKVDDRTVTAKPHDSNGQPVTHTLRRLVVPVYLPWLAVGLGTAMLLPVLPVYLRELDLTVGTVSLILAATGVGAVIAGLPLGGALQRFGERTLLVAAIVVSALSAALLGTTELIVFLLILRFVAGVGSMGVRLAQQTLVARTVEGDVRGRAMSVMGGTVRLAFFVGPVVGGVSSDQLGPEATFVASGAVTALGLLPLLAAKTGSSQRSRTNTSTSPRPPGVLESLRGHWKRLITVGVGPALVTAVRQGRLIVIPLIANDLGLSGTEIGLVVAIGTGADLLLFPMSGWLMDRFGRLYATVPAFGLIGIGLLLLGVLDSTLGVIIAGAVIGIGNGMSAGTMMTIGSDVAPAGVRAPFLAGLGSMQDLGRIIGPLVVGWSADAAGLHVSAVALAVVMFIAIAWLVFVVGETRDLDPT